MKLRKLIPVSVLGIAALALAGCGVFDGDDDDPAPAVSMDDMDMPDDGAETAAQVLTDARAAMRHFPTTLLTPSVWLHKLRLMTPCVWKVTKRSWPRPSRLSLTRPGANSTRSRRMRRMHSPRQRWTSGSPGGRSKIGDH